MVDGEFSPIIGALRPVWTVDEEIQPVSLLARKQAERPWSTVELGRIMRHFFKMRPIPPTRHGGTKVRDDAQLRVQRL
jgi:hypothetical protein